MALCIRHNLRQAWSLALDLLELEKYLTLRKSKSLGLLLIVRVIEPDGAADRLIRPDAVFQHRPENLPVGQRGDPAVNMFFVENFFHAFT